jgi:tetratricopeptide (TPR) repeat protein
MRQSEREMAVGRRVAGRELVRAKVEIEEALVALRSLDDPDVEAHRRQRADENLEQAIARIEDALGTLRSLETGEAEESDVEARRRWSEGNLEQAIERMEDALAALRELDLQESGQEAEVEAHGRRRSRRRLKDAIAMLTEALESLGTIGPQPRPA